MRRESVNTNLQQVYRDLDYLRTINTNNASANQIQCIDTGVKLTENYIKINCKVRFVGGLYGSILAGRDSNGGFQLQGYSGGSVFRLWNGSGASIDIGPTLSTGTDYEIEVICNNNNISLVYNNQSYTNSNGSLPMTSTQNLGMFASIRNTGITSSSNMRIYYLQIYNSSNVCIRDFRPVLRLTDNKPGMYDYVTNSFYTKSVQTAPEFEYE